MKYIFQTNNFREQTIGSDIIVKKKEQSSILSTWILKPNIGKIRNAMLRNVWQNVKYEILLDLWSLPETRCAQTSIVRDLSPTDIVRGSTSLTQIADSDVALLRPCFPPLTTGVNHTLVRRRKLTLRLPMIVCHWFVRVCLSLHWLC